MAGSLKDPVGLFFFFSLTFSCFLSFFGRRTREGEGGEGGRVLAASGVIPNAVIVGVADSGCGSKGVTRIGR